MTDLAGFDATAPLAVPNLPAYRWAAVYVHGRYAARILPSGEQDALPATLALLPISVLSWDSPTGVQVGTTATDGQSDGADYARELAARGWGAGQLVCVDWEWGCEQVAGFASYASALGQVLQQAGYLVAPYATAATLSVIVPSTMDGVWLTDWNGTGDPAAAPWRASHPRFAQQWGGTVAGGAADLNVCTPQFYAALRGAAPVDPQSQSFPNGFTSGGGFYQFWCHNGGLAAFGMPISQEYDTTGADGQPIRRQWYERALFEWRQGWNPGNWDTQVSLLGDLIANADRHAELAGLEADVDGHPLAFKKG